jgi:hypothetical protein
MFPNRSERNEHPYRGPSKDASYQISIHLAKWLQRRIMAATGNSFFWLVDSKQSFPLKLLGQMNRNLVCSIYGRSSVQIAHFVPIR